jgi:RNA polymerase sigma-70 factor (ECF subfamily)
LGVLLETFSDQLTVLARLHIGRRLRGKVDPTDLVQETFLHAHRHIRVFRGASEAELITWLRRILTGQVTTTVRRYLVARGRDVTLEQAITEQCDGVSTSADRGLIFFQDAPGSELVGREQEMLLSEAMQRLPDDYRQAIFLRNLQGLSLTEAARQMGRSQDSVQKLWARGLECLRESMRKMMPVDSAHPHSHLGGHNDA